jgi:hypothetical protein
MLLVPGQGKCLLQGSIAVRRARAVNFEGGASYWAGQEVDGSVLLLYCGDCVCAMFEMLCIS